MLKNVDQLKNQYPEFPDDVPLAFPKDTTLPAEDIHFLLYIPWHERYLRFVPEEYREFYVAVLPYLSARTTDVHIAVCMQYLTEFIGKAEQAGKTVNKNVLAYGLMLHDSGWSQMSQAEVAASLGVKGLILNEKAMEPKEKHAVLGAQIAKDILDGKSMQLGLSDEEIEAICKAILYHDKPTELAGSQNEMPIEVQLLVDLDHLWSFTHLNFWQDILRKNVSPQDYLANLKNDLDQYFVTEIGKDKAKELLAERKEEVNRKPTH